MSKPGSRIESRGRGNNQATRRSPMVPQKEKGVGPLSRNQPAEAGRCKPSGQSSFKDDVLAGYVFVDKPANFAIVQIVIFVVDDVHFEGF